MPQPKKGARLGANPSHQRHMLSNLAASLFIHERIRTTEAKAKTLRPLAERLITKAKKGDVHNRRQVLSVIEDRDVVHKLFDDIAPRFSDRNGGYTRILKIAPRQGDGAPMVLIELVEEGTAPLATTVETPEGKKRRIARPGRRRRAGGEELPQDKPVRSKAAEAWAAGQAVPDADEDAELELEAEASDGDLVADAQEDAAEASVEAEEESAEAAAESAETTEAEAQADAGQAPDAGGEGVKDQK